MGKYLILWDIDTNKIPVDAKERGAGWTLLMEMVKQDMKRGFTKDWGAFVGETSGYAVDEGSEVEVMKALQQYVPFVHFEVHPVASVSQVEEMIKVLTK
jgi:proteasome assembly chaperone (PAC2) family protein